MPTPTVVYLKVVQEALVRTWQQKTLWVFGFFTALLTTGGLLDIGFQTWHTLKQGPLVYTTLTQSTGFSHPIFGHLVLFLQGSSPLTWMLPVLCLLITLGFLAFSVMSRLALVDGLIDNKHKRAGHHLARVEGLFFRGVALTLIQKILALIGLVLATLVAIWLPRTTSVSPVFITLVMLGMCASIVFIHVLTTLAFVDLVKKRHAPSDALKNAWLILKTHALVAIELAVISFVLTTTAMIFFMIIVGVLSLPFFFIATAAVFSESLFLLILTNTVGVFAAFVVGLMLLGIIVTFQHAVWVEFYTRASHKGLAKHLRTFVAHLLKRA